MSKHTPAPWRIVYAGQDDMSEADCIDEDMPVVSIGPINYTEFVNAGSQQERDDARLIAAAPELLEAAREVWDWRGEVFKDPENIGPESGFGAALLRMSRVIEEVEGAE